MLKQIALVFFILMVTCQSSELLTSVKLFFQKNNCLNENLIAPLHSLWNKLDEHNRTGFFNSTESDQQEKIHLVTELVNLLSQTKEIKLLCNLDQELAFLHDDWLQSAGYLFLVTSNCFKDVGAEFLILDSVIQSFQEKKYTDALLNTIFMGILGYQGIQDCKPLFDFFEMKKSHEEIMNSFLSFPNNLGGCSIWEVVRCGTAVASAALVCGGPVSPVIAACFLAALAAVPGCGICLCKQINCPNYCPCS